MNETIGSKGGHNDRIRTIRNKKKKKKKELQEIEKEIKKNQGITLIKTLPIAIVGGVLKTIKDNASKSSNDESKKITECEKGIDTEDTEQIIIIVQKNGKKVRVKVNSKVEDLLIKKEEKKEIKEEKKEDKKEVKEKENKIEEPIDEIEKIEELNSINYDINNDYTTSVINVETLPEDSKDKLKKLKSRKIVDEYSKKLKDIRFDLRQLIFEYNLLVDESDKIVFSKEANVILDKLSDVIERVDELKRKIKIDDLDKYDDNYIYVLIENYFEEFKNKKIVSEMKDSPLYIMISEKLDELDKKKNDLDKEVKSKKNKLNKKEADFKKIKDSYSKISKINNDLIKFQNDQDKLLKDLKDKVDKAITVEEKVKVEMEVLDAQSKKLLRLLTLAMFIPGATAAKSMAASAAAYLYFMKNVIEPKMTTKKYKVITVKDYSDSIEKSISSIDDASSLLGKTSKQIDKMISKVSEEFKEYRGVIKECDELIYNLKKIKRNLSEKEYELSRIKKEQQKVLENNNAKVLKLGTYPM